MEVQGVEGGRLMSNVTLQVERSKDVILVKVGINLDPFESFIYYI